MQFKSQSQGTQGSLLIVNPYKIKTKRQITCLQHTMTQNIQFCLFWLLEMGEMLFVCLLF